MNDASGPRCEYRGPFVQSGRMGRITGAFTCVGGDFTDGTFEVTDFEVTEHGISGFLRQFAPGLNASGRFAAVRQ